MVQCRGTGSPTVSGGFEAGWLWTYALAPDDPIHALPYDAFGLGEGNPQKREIAVFPAVSKFTRVCLYDRPNTTVGKDIDLERGGMLSTPFSSRMRSPMTSPTSMLCSVPPTKLAPSCWRAIPMAA